MADTCTCPPADNIYCRALGELGIFQPECQIIPNGDRVSNPYYDTANNISYYSYGIIDVCDNTPINVRDFLVSICENTPLESIMSCELQLDGCPDFFPVNFDFNNSGGQTPIAGFRFLRVLINQDIEAGSCGIVRIAFAGNFPPTVATPDGRPGYTIVNVNQSGGTGVTLFPPDQSLYAGCPPVPRVTVTKTCISEITSNMATLDYRVIVANTGNVDLENVGFTDTVNFNASAITLGMITVTPNTIQVDTSMPGMIRFTGDLGTIPIGQSIEITYTLPISAITTPGTFTFNNLAIATSGEIQGSGQCNVSIEAVQLTTDICCIIEEDEEILRLSISNPSPSPDTQIDYDMLINISADEFVTFTSFDGCIATFVDTGEVVPIGTILTDTSILLECIANLPSNITTIQNIRFTVDGTTNFSPTPGFIEGIINRVELQNPDDQILISVTPLPNTARITIEGNITCNPTENN